MKQVLLLAALISSSAAFAVDPPGIVWENIYGQYTEFRAVCAMQDGTYLAAGSGGIGEFCRIAGTGEILGSTDIPLPGTCIYAAEPLPDGGVIAAGCGGNDPSLLIVRLDASGAILWTRSYGWVGTTEVGFDVEPLSDGSFAACGYRQQAGMQNQAWILRMDSAGDTLWTRTLGEDHNDYAWGLEDSPQGILVACAARLGTPSQWGFLASYGLDGSLLATYTYDEIWYPNGIVDVCHSQDGGFVFLGQYCYFDTNVVGIDSGFDFVWLNDTPENNYNLSWRIRQTSDSGYIVARQNDYASNPDPPPTYEDWNAALSRYDSSGERLWSLSLERPDSCFFHDVLQLPSGGYLAVGRIRTPAEAGYMVRFGPETGIGQQPAAPVLMIGSCVPNPGTDVFSLSWSTGLPGSTVVRVFDVSGRLRMHQELGLTSEGGHSTQLDLSRQPSGCYLVVVCCGTQSASTKLVLLD